MTVIDDRQTPPEGLSASSLELWGDLADLAVWSLDAADLKLLAEIARHNDRLASIGDELSRDGLTVTGSKGQVRPHPLLVTESTLRRQEMVYLDQWRQRCSGARLVSEMNGEIDVVTP